MPEAPAKFAFDVGTPAKVFAGLALVLLAVGAGGRTFGFGHDYFFAAVLALPATISTVAAGAWHHLTKSLAIPAALAFALSWGLPAAIFAGLGWMAFKYVISW